MDRTRHLPLMLHITTASFAIYNTYVLLFLTHGELVFCVV